MAMNGRRGGFVKCECGVERICTRNVHLEVKVQVRVRGRVALG